VDIRYIEDVTDFTACDPLLLESITLYLAWDIALKITKSSETKQQMFEAWKLVHMKAKSADAQEEPADQIRANTYTNGRSGDVSDLRIPLRDYPEYPLS
jgi:hypothetical protein